MEKVLVTGATGFIGLHCIHQLLNQGYAVNGSVRSPDRKNEIIEALQKHNTSTENLNLFTFNLTEDNGWDEGMSGCDYLLHVASPIALENHDEDFFVKPAVAGVNRAFKFAKKHKINVVMDRCPKIEYSRLSGELGWAGINSGTFYNKRRIIRSIMK